MRTLRIIPCLDVNEGRVVKGVNFVDLIDAGDPVEQAKIYNAQGADELCFLDITASHEDRDTIVDVVNAVAREVFIPMTVGGGIKNLEDIRKLLNAGADKISVNSAAIRNPDFIAEASRACGNQCVVVAIDAKKTKPGKWEIFTHGGRRPTGIDAVDWARRMESNGAGEILLTSMDADGTKQGFDTDLTASVAGAVNIPVIASGGAGNAAHMVEAVTKGKADAVLAASIFHFAETTINAVKQEMQQAGLPIRPTHEKPQ